MRSFIKSEDLTADYVRARLHYDPDTGIFTRRMLSGGQKPGEVAGWVHHSGYVVVSVGRRQRPAHRLAWLIQTGEWPVDQIDHINRKRDDNRWTNLRAVTRNQNLKNKSLYRNNSTGVTGVYYEKTCRKWRASIQVDGKMKLSPVLNTFEEAVALRAANVEEHYGIYARKDEP